MTQTKTQLLESNYLKQARPYTLWWPQAYLNKLDCFDSRQGCPVLYLLDSNWYADDLIKRLIPLIEAGQIPPIMVVGIHNSEDRVRDLTPSASTLDWNGKPEARFEDSGGGDAFLNFIEKELVPQVEMQCCSTPYRILAGHSLGGLLALHSLITRPQLFQAHILVDCSLWWQHQSLIKHVEVELAKARDIRNQVFVGIASQNSREEESLAVMDTAGERLVKALAASPSPGLKSQWRRFEGESHGTVALPGFYAGLRFIFDRVG